MIINEKVNILIFSILIFLILYLGKFLFVPLLFSILIYVVLKSLSNKLSSFKPLKISGKFSFLLVSVLFIGLIYFTGILLESNLSKVIKNSQIYQNNSILILNFLKETKVSSVPLSLEQFMTNLNFAQIFSKILNIITDFASNFSLILIYLIFILLEDDFFKSKIEKLSSDKSSIKILKKANTEIFSYFQLKTLTSFFTGLLTFILLYFFNIDLAVFFGILSFVLNFIPFLGSLISIILPFLFSLIQFLDFFQSSLLLILLIFIQIFIGNFIEPKLMGKSLNLSPIIMLITLSIMGNLWGISGMFLSIPILVILLIVFSNFRSTKKIAILLSEKGEIN